MYGTKKNSLALAEIDVSTRNRSSTFAAQHLLGTCMVAGSGTRLHFNVILALSSTVIKLGWGMLGYIADSMLK